MTRYTLFVAVLLTGISVGHAQEPTNASHWKLPKDKHNFHVFLLMGQSNMSGGTKMLPEDKKPTAHVVMLPTISKRPLMWQPAAHPLHNRRPNFGPGLSFAVEYLKDKPGVVVGLIPVAWGGSPIDGLKAGTPTYKDAIKKAKFASAEGEIKGVLWHQGESDTVTVERSESYEGKLHQLILDLRRDLGVADLPFIVGNLAEFYGTGKDHRAPDRVRRINKIRKVLRSVPDKIADTEFVESTGCTSPDKHMVHFDRRSYLVLGERYARAFASVIAKREQDAGQPATAPELKTEGNEKPKPESEVRPQ
jgi:hypothetical protein